tara:strand:+ start:2807 stop:4444 length:1638 start_codon:yes stop_codon:yes gene_type:complete
MKIISKFLFVVLSLVIFPDERPNILLIMAEDMSLRINALGDKTAITPNLDEFVKNGTSYMNAFTTAGVCACSRSALLTGKNQISIGSMHMRTSSGGSVPYLAVPEAHIKAFPEILRKQGYYTFTNDKLDYQFSGIFPGSGPFTIWNSEQEKFGWKNRKNSEPFFGIINLLITHESGLFRGKMNSVDTQAIKLMQQTRQMLYDAPVKPKNVIVPPFLPDTFEVRKDIARAYNNIYILDIEVKEIIDQLKRDNIFDDTIIIFTSDNGDGLPRYKRELFDTGINVPFLILVPKKFSTWRNQGKKTFDLVSFLDIAPTVLDLAGVAIPSYMDGKSIFGSEKNEYIFAARDRLDTFKGKTRAVRNKDYKFIKNYSLGIVGAQKLSFRENLMSMKELRKMYENNELNEIQKSWLELIPELQLYDLNEDPHEINNLAYDPNYKEEVLLLENVLEEWIEKNNFHGHLEEDDLIEVFWPANTQPQTKGPLYSLENGLLHLKNDNASKNASIGISYDGKNWEVYTKPIEIKKIKKIYFKAVRYGWKESETKIVKF